MKPSQTTFVRAVATGVCLALALAATSLAQGRGGGGPPGGGPGGAGMGGGQFPGGGPTPGNSAPGSYNPGPGIAGQPLSRSQSVEGRPGLRFGPPGVRWWDDHGFAKSLKLRPEQQQRMDAIFEQNRNALVTSFEGVRQAETQLETLSRSPSPDESALFSQIDRVAQARAELEKVNTHLLLQIRKEMDADQIKRLEKASQP